MTTELTRADLLRAAEPHVPFDGWSEATFQAAARDLGLSPAQARLICPRGPVDLARAYHEACDARMLAQLESADLSALRFRDRIARAVQIRLEVGDREIVRRGVTLFSLPHLAPEGTAMVWRTADLIWTVLGDTSVDVNWYTKRATLAGVYGAVVLYWLGDDSPGAEATRAFLDRRIDDVMQIEKIKAQVRENKLLSGLLAGPAALLAQVRAPAPRDGLPGRWKKGS